MANNIVSDSLQRISFVPIAYTSKSINAVLDRNFKEFGQKTSESKDISSAVEQFFIDYEDLFYSIPITGTTGSHQYLAERSAQIAKISAGEALYDIEPLLNEITQLRSQSVVDQQEIINLRLQLSQSGE